VAIKSTVQSLSLLSVSLERHRVEAMSLPCAAGVIMFSDILTPLPSMGIDFDVIKGSGPCIFDPIRSMDQASLPTPLLPHARRARSGCAHAALATCAQVKVLKKIDDPEKTVPFLQPILSSLRKETEGKATLLGFIGAPFTLAAYSIEGKADKNLIQTKRMMLYNPEIVHVHPLPDRTPLLRLSL
jgi:uroporphyrinogen decarboxylase